MPRYTLSTYVRRHPTAISASLQKLTCTSQGVTDIDIDVTVLDALTRHAPAVVRTAAAAAIAAHTSPHARRAYSDASLSHHVDDVCSRRNNNSDNSSREEGSRLMPLRHGRGHHHSNNNNGQQQQQHSSNGMNLAIAIGLDTVLLSRNKLDNILGIVQFRHVVRLSLLGNALRRIDDCEPLALLPALAYVSLEYNPVTALPHYRAHMLRITAWPHPLTPQHCRLRRLDAHEVTPHDVAAAVQCLQREAALLPTLTQRLRLCSFLADVERRLRLHAELRRRGVLVQDTARTTATTTTTSGSSPSLAAAHLVTTLLTRCASTALRCVDGTHATHMARLLLLQHQQQRQRTAAVASGATHITRNGNNSGNSGSDDDDDTSATANATLLPLSSSSLLSVSAQFLRDDDEKDNDNNATHASSASSSPPPRLLRDIHDSDDAQTCAAWSHDPLRRVVTALDMRICAHCLRVARLLSAAHVTTHDVDAVCMAWLDACAAYTTATATTTTTVAATNTVRMYDTHVTSSEPCTRTCVLHVAADADSQSRLDADTTLHKHTDTKMAGGTASDVRDSSSHHHHHHRHHRSDVDDDSSCTSLTLNALAASHISYAHDTALLPSSSSSSSSSSSLSSSRTPSPVRAPPPQPTRAMTSDDSNSSSSGVIAAAHDAVTASTRTATAAPCDKLLPSPPRLPLPMMTTSAATTTPLSARNTTPQRCSTDNDDSDKDNHVDDSDMRNTAAAACQPRPPPCRLQWRRARRLCGERRRRRIRAHRPRTACAMPREQAAAMQLQNSECRCDDDTAAAAAVVAHATRADVDSDNDKKTVAAMRCASRVLLLRRVMTMWWRRCMQHMLLRQATAIHAYVLRARIWTRWRSHVAARQHDQQRQQQRHGRAHACDGTAAATTRLTAHATQPHATTTTMTVCTAATTATATAATAATAAACTTSASASCVRAKSASYTDTAGLSDGAHSVAATPLAALGATAAADVVRVRSQQRHGQPSSPTSCMRDGEDDDGGDDEDTPHIDDAVAAFANATAWRQSAQALRAERQTLMRRLIDAQMAVEEQKLLRARAEVTAQSLRDELTACTARAEAAARAQHASAREVQRLRSAVAVLRAERRATLEQLLTA